jgi:KUP system potassium uptake protein
MDGRAFPPAAADPPGRYRGSRNDDKLSYFLSRIELARGSAPGMSRWRKRLFVATSRITADAAEL